MASSPILKSGVTNVTNPWNMSPITWALRFTCSRGWSGNRDLTYLEAPQSLVLWSHPPIEACLRAKWHFVSENNINYYDLCFSYLQTKSNEQTRIEVKIAFHLQVLTKYLQMKTLGFHLGSFFWPHWASYLPSVEICACQWKRHHSLSWNFSMFTHTKGHGSLPD